MYGPKISMTMANQEGWTSKNGSKWKTMPEVMIQYRAASFFGRMNCPDMIMGIYSSDEVLDMGDIPTDGFALVVDPVTGEVSEEEIEGNKPITQEQRKALFKTAKEKLGDKANDVIRTLMNEQGYESTDGMPVSVYNLIMDKITELINNIEGAAEENMDTDKEKSEPAK